VSARLLSANIAVRAQLLATTRELGTLDRRAERLLASDITHMTRVSLRNIIDGEFGAAPSASGATLLDGLPEQLATHTSDLRMIIPSVNERRVSRPQSADGVPQPMNKAQRELMGIISHITGADVARILHNVRSSNVLYVHASRALVAYTDGIRKHVAVIAAALDRVQDAQLLARYTDAWWMREAAPVEAAIAAFDKAVHAYGTHVARVAKAAPGV
jgi:hypothetical protein